MIEFLRSNHEGSADGLLRTAVSMLSLYDPQARDMSTRGEQRESDAADGADIFARSGLRPAAERQGVILADPSLSFAANFLYMLTGKKPDEVMEQAFDVALILHADHELNASTFAARVTAATLSDIYSAVTSAIGALKGPLHGGANEDVIRMLLQVADPEKAVERVREDAEEQGQDPGLWTSRVPDGRSARDASAGAVGGAWQAHGAGEALPDVQAGGGDDQGREEAERERGLLLGDHLLLAGHSDRSVHADLRREPDVGMDGACARAVPEQPADPAARGVQRQRGRHALGSARGT